MLMGKYASQRKQFLENHAPRMLQSMIESGTLDEHLQTVQKLVSEYVSERVSEYERNNEEYRAAQESGDFQRAYSLLHTETVYAEYDGGSAWIYVLPDGEDTDDEYDEDDDYEDEYDDDYDDYYDDDYDDDYDE